MLRQAVLDGHLLAVVSLELAVREERLHPAALHHRREAAGRVLALVDQLALAARGAAEVDRRGHVEGVEIPGHRHDRAEPGAGQAGRGGGEAPPPRREQDERDGAGHEQERAEQAQGAEAAEGGQDPVGTQDRPRHRTQGVDGVREAHAAAEARGRGPDAAHHEREGHADEGGRHEHEGEGHREADRLHEEKARRGAGEQQEDAGHAVPDPERGQDRGPREHLARPDGRGGALQGLHERLGEARPEGEAEEQGAEHQPERVDRVPDEDGEQVRPDDLEGEREEATGEGGGSSAATRRAGDRRGPVPAPGAADAPRPRRDGRVATRARTRRR